MAHVLGGLAFPFATPSGSEALTDPSLDVFAEFFRAVLSAHAATAWSATFPGEPFIRKVFKHDPEEADFSELDLPALYLWREQVTGERSIDSHSGKRSILSVMWVAPPSGGQDRIAKRTAFLNGFASSIARAVEHQRDPAWIHPTEVAAASALSWGSSIRKWAGFSQWEFQKCERQGLAIELIDGAVRRYTCLTAEINLWELSETDVSQFTGLASPPAIELTLTSGGETPMTRQHEVEPDPP